MDWLAVQYIGALNIIHYMHDKVQLSEASLMALHRDVYPDDGVRHRQTVGGGGFLSAIRYAG